MWMFVKVMLAMSAAAGLAAMPTVLHSVHDQTRTTGHSSVTSTPSQHTSTNNTTTTGSFSIQTSGSTEGSSQTTKTVTVYTGGTGTFSFWGDGDGHVTFLPGPVPKPPHPPSPPSPPSKPPKPGGGTTQSATVTWGKVLSFGNDKLTILPNGKSAMSFMMNGQTKFVYTSGPIQAPDENRTNLSRLKVGDNVMVVSHNGMAVLIVDRGGISGPYSPLGGKGALQGGVSVQVNGAMSASDR